ncbi:hypothetical protein HDU97_001141 [Phlyctochytrium planicorne]|nr:hypothetical protein HDU97_001141 [Phlyctochytrium planicorne]
MIYCDGCNRAFHLHCLALETVPDGDWFCFICSEESLVEAEPKPFVVPAVSGTIRRNRRSRRATAPRSTTSNRNVSYRSSIMMAIRREMAESRRQRSRPFRYLPQSTQEPDRQQYQQLSNFNPFSLISLATLPAKRRFEEESEPAEKGDPSDPFSDIWKQFDACRKLDIKASPKVDPKAMNDVQSCSSSSSAANKRPRTVGDISPVKIHSGGGLMLEEFKPPIPQTTESRKGKERVHTLIPSASVSVASTMAKEARSPSHFSKTELFPFIKKELDFIWHKNQSAIGDSMQYKVLAKSVTEAVFERIKDLRVRKNDSARIEALVKEELQTKLMKP